MTRITEFSNYVDVYEIAQAVEDGATVRIFHESRLVKINLSEEGKRLIDELDEDWDDVKWCFFSSSA